jgi:hypothetical protein
MGRGNDKMLMHVTPAEVAGLQSIAMAAGGSLSVNPQTGLPEAGFFDFLGNILPEIAGTAIGVATGNPYIGAAVAGAGKTAQTGNLMSGIMAGLGAYGGANFAQGVANAGATGAGATGAGAAGAGTAATTGAGITPAAAQSALGQTAGTSGFTGAGSIGLKAPELAASQLSTSGVQMGGALPTLGDIGIGSVAGPAELGGSTLGTMSAKAPMTLENISGGLKNIMGEGGIKALQAGLGEAGKPITTGQLASRAALPIAQLAMSAVPRPGSLIDDSSDSFGNTPSLADYQKRYRGYAQGGALELNPMMQDTSRQGLNLDMRDHPLGEPNQANGGYAKGGYLDGPGDGMSDSIPATIEGKQPARLADGEFVIPADVVSHLGNGSTKAGAQRLYDMMSKVRRARTGNSKQGKQIKADKFIPT